VLSATAPGAPTLQSATADQQAGAVTVAFTAPPAVRVSLWPFTAPPTPGGGAPITEYRVRCRETNTVVRVTSASPVVFTGLPRGEELTFEVVAVNAAGQGPASAASQPVRLGETRRGPVI
jgi:hypothetical protein